MDAALSMVLATTGSSLLTAAALEGARFLKDRAAAPKKVRAEVVRIGKKVDSIDVTLGWIRVSLASVLGAVEVLLQQEQDRCEDCPSRRPSSEGSVDAALAEVRRNREGP
jgi:hypothetical protein